MLLSDLTQSSNFRYDASPRRSRWYRLICSMVRFCDRVIFNQRECIDDMGTQWSRLAAVVNRQWSLVSEIPRISILNLLTFLNVTTFHLSEYCTQWQPAKHWSGVRHCAANGGIFDILKISHSGLAGGFNFQYWHTTTVTLSTLLQRHLWLEDYNGLV